MKLVLFLSLFLLSGITYAQTTEDLPQNEEAPKPIKDNSLEELKNYVINLTKDVSEKINPYKVNGFGKNLTSKVKFSVNEKLQIEKNSIEIIGDNSNFNAEVEQIVKPLLSEWKPTVETNPTRLSRYFFEFPVGISYDK